MGIGLSSFKDNNGNNNVKDDKTILFEYSKNPFTPKGRMNRLYYFIYITLINLISKIIDVYATQNSLYENPDSSLLVFIIYLTILTFQLFIIKKRILDITNNNKKSWVFASLFVGIGSILATINQYLALIIAPFGLYILLKESYGVGETCLETSEISETKTLDTVCTHCNKKVRKAKYCSNCGGQLSEVQEM